MDVLKSKLTTFLHIQSFLIHESIKIAVILTQIRELKRASHLLRAVHVTLNNFLVILDPLPYPYDIMRYLPMTPPPLCRYGYILIIRILLY